MFRHVDDQIGDLKGFRLRGIGAAQARPNAGDELLRLKGLGDVIIRAGFKAQDHVHGIGLGCQHDDGHRGFAPDGAANIHTVHARQHKIQKDEIRFVLAEGRNGIVAIHDGDGV